MKLRGQLAVASEKAAEEGDSEPEEFDVFRMFRLIGSLLLAVFVRVSVCQYLVSLGLFKCLLYMVPWTVLMIKYILLRLYYKCNVTLVQ